VSRLTDVLQDGPYDSRVLNHHKIREEPFPVKISLRSEAYGQLIAREAEKAGILQSEGF
jgi:hypothetical protein